MDIRLLFNEGFDFGKRVPARFLSLTSESGEISGERETISVFGNMSEKPAFVSETGESRNVPMLIVTSSARHDDIAVRAFEISESRESAAPEGNWLRAENELLGLT